uniref:Fatty acyl-CoA reductase n=1 Tax=Timema tahoe TaxID=61484 RepID=A0A7R9IU63_9NEOP|nr:unnamed protein product [Timema tahoe]
MSHYTPVSQFYQDRAILVTGGTGFMGKFFNRIRKEQPLAVNKVIPIEGDITRPDLGISLSDQNVITRTVSIVFHSAATVRFDEVLKVSVQTNMVGTKQLVQLCHKILKLEVS